MRILTPRRLVALAIGAACVALMATPAAAVTYAFDLVDGTITFTAPNSNHFDIDFGGSVSECPPSTIDIDFIGTASGGAVWMRDVDIHLVDTLLGGDYYLHLTDTTILDDSQIGTYGSPSGSESDVDLGLYLDVFESDVEDCNAGNFVCTLVFDMDLYGSYTGTAPSGVTGVSLSGGSGDVGPTPYPSCDAPFATYIDGWVSITDPLDLA